MEASTAILIATSVQAVIVVLGILFLIWLIFLAIPGFFNGPPYLGAKKELVNDAFRLADIKPGQIFVDCGSGDGRMLIEAAKRGAKTTGYEINLFLVWWSRIKSIFSGQRKNIKIHWCNFFKADLSGVDMVLLYCTDGPMVRLAKKMVEEMSSGSKIITVRYPLPGWKEVKKDGKAFLYIIEK